jgi:hypothetical protein
MVLWMSEYYCYIDVSVTTDCISLERAYGILTFRAFSFRIRYTACEPVEFAVVVELDVLVDVFSLRAHHGRFILCMLDIIAIFVEFIKISVFIYYFIIFHEAVFIE